MKIKKGDTVKIIRGKDQGKTGPVEKVFPQKGKVLVGGVNVYKKHLKPRQGQRGGIIELTKPLLISNLKLVCPTCHKPTRVGYQLGKLSKERICKKCGTGLDKTRKGNQS